MDGWVYPMIDGSIGGWMDVCIDGSMDGWTTNCLMDGWNSLSFSNHFLFFIHSKLNIMPRMAKFLDLSAKKSIGCVYN